MSTIKIHTATANELTHAMSTIVDWVDPASTLAIVYFVMMNLPKALGLNHAKRKTSHS